MGFDAIVVGGGSAGCVLAARLSEEDGRRVLLLEAGPDYGARDQLPNDLADGWTLPASHDWGYRSEPDELGRSIDLPRGRVKGGSSAVNACFALRGSPADYDGWAELGNPGWAFQDVLPFFRMLENDADFGSESWHGNAGPIPIRRYPSAERTPVHDAFIEGAEAAGHPVVDDHNRPWAVGIGPTPVNAVRGLRLSTALTYLAAARARPNLTVRSGVTIDRLKVSRGRVTGVRLCAPEEDVDGDGVVLAAGAYGSPPILLRSGIGPADELADLGIEAEIDLVGVGQNLIDHPIKGAELPIRPAKGPAPMFQSVLTFHSSHADPAGPPDLQIVSSGPWNEGHEAVFSLVGSVLKPKSRGSITLSSSDPAAHPRIRLNHLGHPDDLARMIEAIHHASASVGPNPWQGLRRPRRSGRDHPSEMETTRCSGMHSGPW